MDVVEVAVGRRLRVDAGARRRRRCAARRLRSRASAARSPANSPMRATSGRRADGAAPRSDVSAARTAARARRWRPRDGSAAGRRALVRRAGTRSSASMLRRMPTAPETSRAAGGGQPSGDAGRGRRVARQAVQSAGVGRRVEPHARRRPATRGSRPPAQRPATRSLASADIVARQLAAAGDEAPVRRTRGGPRWRRGSPRRPRTSGRGPVPRRRARRPAAARRAPGRACPRRETTWRARYR